MKKPKSAWNRFVLWAGVAGLLLAGCAKPVETALPAMQLDLAQMLEKASAGTEDGAWPLAQRYGVPPHVLEDISAVDGRLQIRLNADTVVPQAAQVPILRVKRAVHNPDAVNALVSGMKGQLTFDENNPASFLFVARGPYYGIDCHQRTVTGPESFTDGEWALLTISPAEARAAAEQFIAAHNLPMAVQYISVLDALYKSDGANKDIAVLSQTYYTMECTRQFSGIGCSASLLGGTGNHFMTKDFWPNERMSISVNGDGVAGFSWSNPVEQTNVVLENAALLPFDEIMGVFRKLIVAVNRETAANESYARSICMDVNRIALEYQRIVDPGAADGTGLLVPAWCFYGDMRVDEIVSGEGTLAEWELGQPMLFASINAIDGTLIDAGPYRSGYIR